ncbi:hypothetical protein [Leucobacter soli]|uniref:Uncharacterized protein n=1 Tax=Leucobacter soli TaxID=2812850 RepID=A0A916JWY5_9MICO|nr:hypothetical protein LEUCIP111803_01118 [Leucobacter soli]
MPDIDHEYAKAAVCAVLDANYLAPGGVPSSAPIWPGLDTGGKRQ